MASAVAVEPMPTAPAARRDFTPVELFALIFVVCTGFSSQMVMPLWIGAIIDDLQLTRTAAGAIASFEFAAVAIVSVFIAVQVHRFNARRTAALGLLLLIVGNLLAAFAQDVTQLTACRIVTGCGKGLVVAVTFSLAAGASNPTRMFALLNGAYALFSTIFYLCVPPFIRMGGAGGAFLMMSGVAVLGALMLVKFPERRMQDSVIRNLRLADVSKFGFVALVALIVLWVGHNAIWTFVERLGTRVDLTVAQIGGVLAYSAFFTIGGPALALVIGTRFGHTVPIVGALLIKCVAVACLVFLASKAAFLVAVPVFLVLALFTVPYVMGILSLADPAGRLAAASSAAMTAGGSLGALVGGVTADAAGYPGLAWVAIGHFLVVIVLMLWMAPRLRNADGAPLSLSH